MFLDIFVGILIYSWKTIYMGATYSIQVCTTITSNCFTIVLEWNFLKRMNKCKFHNQQFKNSYTSLIIHFIYKQSITYTITRYQKYITGYFIIYVLCSESLLNRQKLSYT